MDLNTLFSSGPILALVGVLATIVINYFIQLKKGGTDQQIADRKVLSEDQEHFKQSILTELKDCRNSVDKLAADCIMWQTKAIQVQEQKLSLTEEIIRLTQRIFELERALEEFKQTVAKLRGEIEGNNVQRKD